MLGKLVRKVKVELMKRGILEPKIEFSIDKEKFEDMLNDLYTYKSGFEESVPTWVSEWCKAFTLPKEVKHLPLETIKELIRIAEKEKRGEELSNEEKALIKRWKEEYNFVKREPVEQNIDMYYKCVKKQMEKLIEKYT